MPAPYGGLRYWLLPLLRLRILRIVGRENLPPMLGGFLIAANHNAWVDSPLLVAALFRRLKKQMFFISRSHRYTSGGSIPIDPENPKSVIPRCIKKLNAGHVIAVYPEGRSNPLRSLRRPRTGIARLAHLTGLPVVPVGIRGTFGVSMLVSTLCFFSFWKPITFHFGLPLTFPKVAETDLTKELLEETAAIIMQAISPLAKKPFHPDELGEV